jgi:hypothetical protein
VSEKRKVSASLAACCVPALTDALTRGMGSGGPGLAAPGGNRSLDTRRN